MQIILNNGNNYNPMKRNIFVVLVLGIFLLFGCIGQPTDIKPPEPDTNTTFAKVVQYGDAVAVEYVLILQNGTVYDTNSESVAKSSGSYDPLRKYIPLTFTVAKGAGLIDGFVEGVIGMKAGGKRQIEVPPEKGYGIFDPDKLFSIPLYYEKERFEVVPIEWLESQNILIKNGQKVEIKNDTVFQTNIGLVSIYNFTNETANLEYLLSLGSKFKFNGLPQIVVNKSADSFTIKYDLEAGKDYVTFDSKSGTQKFVRVLLVNETSAIMDENHPLAGQTLLFNVTMLAIK